MRLHRRARVVIEAGGADRVGVLEQRVASLRRIRERHQGGDVRSRQGEAAVDLGYREVAGGEAALADEVDRRDLPAPVRRRVDAVRGSLDRLLVDCSILEDVPSR